MFWIRNICVHTYKHNYRFHSLIFVTVSFVCLFILYCTHSLILHFIRLWIMGTYSLNGENWDRKVVFVNGLPFLIKFKSKKTRQNKSQYSVFYSFKLTK